MDFDEAQVKKDAIARFPAEFGLRAFPGERFRLSQGASYFRNWGDADSLMLYTQRYDADQDRWLDFAKGTEPELRREVVEL